jgi:hypothetical protein
MRQFTELQALIRVNSSIPNPDEGKETYRLWDFQHAIPRDAEAAFIFLEGRWQEMSFNTNWGMSYDLDKEGTWLKQKASRNFSATIGDHTYPVKYTFDA